MLKNKSFQNYLLWSILIIVILLTIVIRVRLLSVPLERDEGLYAYMGQLLLQGVPLYDQAYGIKFPGIYFIYGLILAVFGQTHVGIHFALLLVNLATVLLLYRLGKRLFNNWVGVISASAYALMLLGVGIQGFWANAEHFVVFLALTGVLLMVKALDSSQLKHFFWSGVFFGLALITKQPGLFFLIFAFGYLVFRFLKNRQDSRVYWIRKICFFSLGVAVVMGLTCLYLILFNVFHQFWFLTIRYVLEYVSEITFFPGLINFYHSLIWVAGPYLLFWLIALIGLVFLWQDKELRSRRVFITGFFVASFIAICPGLYFRPHYFTLLMPAICLLIGIGLYSITKFFMRLNFQLMNPIILISLIFVILLHPILVQKDFLFQLSPEAVCRRVYPAPFPESLEIANYIKQQTSSNDKIAIIGSEPQIYFYSHRRAATPYLYVDWLREKQKFALQMQKEMISEIETNHPELLIFVNHPNSWGGTSPDLAESLINWFKQYTEKEYNLVYELTIDGSIKHVSHKGHRFSVYRKKSS